MAAFEIMTGTSQESLAIKAYVTRVYKELYGVRPSDAAMFQPIQDILKALSIVQDFAPYIRQAANQDQVDETLLASVLLVENMDLAPLEKETGMLGQQGQSDDPGSYGSSARAFGRSVPDESRYRD